MHLNYCKKHKIQYNSDTSKRCPICVHGKPKVDSGYTFNFSSPKKDFSDQVQKRRERIRQMRKEFVDKEMRKLRMLKESRKIAEEIKHITSSHKKTAERVEVLKRTILILRDKYGLSFPRIGKLLNRDHSTIMHHYKNK